MSGRENPAHVERWLAEPLPKDVALSIERLAAVDDVVHQSSEVTGVVDATPAWLLEPSAALKSLQLSRSPVPSRDFVARPRPVRTAAVAAELPHPRRFCRAYLLEPLE